MNSIYFEARNEELKFLETQLANSECCENNQQKIDILADWNRFKFWFWLGARIREHFRGEKFWLEFNKVNFGKAKDNSVISNILVETEKIEQALATENLISFREKQDLIDNWQKLNNKLF